jgi:hypothetical protein
VKAGVCRQAREAPGIDEEEKRRPRSGRSRFSREAGVGCALSSPFHSFGRESTKTEHRSSRGIDPPSVVRVEPAGCLSKAETKGAHHTQQGQAFVVTGARHLGDRTHLRRRHGVCAASVVGSNVDRSPCGKSAREPAKPRLRLGVTLRGSRSVRQRRRLDGSGLRRLERNER